MSPAPPAPAASPRSFQHTDFDAAALAGVRDGRRVAVCLPARNEQDTVGRIVAGVRSALTAVGGGVDLVAELLVVDDGSTDDTAGVAEAAGARVIASGAATAAGPAGAAGGRTPAGARRRSGGKGQAMRRAVAETEAEILVFLDADVENFAPHFVTGLVGPLLARDDVALVKGFYERPLHGEPGGGGRVTELVARPVIDLLFPHLAGVRQPLAGETAAPRTVLDKLELAPGYGVELGLLVDVTARFGVDQLAQVDLGVRVHRNRPLSELRVQATDVLQTALGRAGRDALAAFSGTGPGPASER